MNTEIENTVKQCFTCEGYQNKQPHVKATPYIVLVRPWEVVGTDALIINNKCLLCIVDYYSIFAVIKKMESLSAKELIWAGRVVFAEFGLPKNWFQMQAQILFQSNLKIFVGTST